VLVDEYMDRHGLCLARVLQAYGNLVGLAVLHYPRSTALPEVEFDALRRFLDAAAVALAGARTRNELRAFAYTDPLTGLANRRRLEEEFARRRGTMISLLLIDFDGLKAVNDTLGYDRGDVLIAQVGQRLSASADPGEVITRYGGDEFVIIIPDAMPAAARARAEELMQIFDGLELPDDVERLFHGASVGSATAEAGEDPWDVLKRASAEMRSRKRRRKTDRDPDRTSA
jgi:diguanylate cyclase (GGDEF)-like protein